jgi:gliding motility-associated-like protein
MTRILLKAIALVFTAFYTQFAYSQDEELSTEGKRFWLTFMENIGTGSTINQFKVVISGNKAVTGTIKNIRQSTSQSFSLPAGGGVTTVFVTAAVGVTSGSEATSDRDRGLLIESSDTIAVSAQSTRDFSADAALIYPVDALGVDYRIVSNPGDARTSGITNANYRSTCAIVATEDNTMIDITPNCNTEGGRAAGTTFTITLQRGETYHIRSATRLLDLSGTLIQARDCKKIAVFGGANRSSVLHPSCPSGTTSFDHLYEQMMPMNIWGKKFAFIPTIWSATNIRRFECVRFVTSQNSTVVRMNGRTKILSSAGMSDTFCIVTNQNRPEGIIIANKPIAVCQLLMSERCDGSSSNTDPAMIWVPPLEQTLKRLNFSCERANTINKFFINVVVKTRFKNQLLIDGAAPTATWKLVQFDTSYSYIQQSGLTEGKHNLTHPVGFYAMLYAYGDYGSYGFNAGSSIKPLSFFSIVNGKSSADFEADSNFFSVCQGTSIPFDGGASSTSGVSWKWHIKPPVGSLFTRTTRTFTYTFPDTGVYKVSMIAIRAANGTCNGSSTVEDTVKTEVRVYNKPFIRLMKDTTICFGNNFKLKSQTNGDSNYVFSPATWLSCTNCFEPTVTPLKDTAYTVVATRFGCQPSRDTMRVFLRDSFYLSVSNDTTICRGTSAQLKASVMGGLSSNLKVHWSHQLGSGLTKTVSPKITTTYMAVLTDSCSRNQFGDYYADTNYIKVTVYDSLKITMPNDTLVCEGNSVDLPVSITGGRPGTSVVNWNQGLGQGLSKTVTMSNDTVTYKAVLSDGCTNPKDSGFVTVFVRPSIKIDSVNFVTPICKNTPFKIKARASGGDSLGYIFKLYDLTSGFVLKDSFKFSRNPEFTLQIKDKSRFRIVMNQACNSQQISSSFINIDIKNGLVANANIPVDTICTGQSYNIQFNGTSSESNPIKFVLRRKNGPNYQAIDSLTHSSAASFLVTPTLVLTEYQMIADDNCSRPDTAFFKLYIRTPLTLAALADDQLCRNEAKTLVANPSGGRVQSYDYRWYEVSNNNTLGQNKSINYTPNQSMEIGLEVNDGCSAPVSRKATLMVAPIVSDSTLAVDLEGCEPYNTTIFHPKTIGTAPLNPDFTWKWYFDGNNTINVPSSGGLNHPDIPRNYATSGIFNIRVDMQLPNNKICHSFSEIIDVWKQAVADFDWTPVKIDIVEPEVSFTNKSIGATQYQWSMSDGGSYSDANPKHSFKDTGMFTITLNATNVNGCDSSITKSLRVLDIFRIFIPGAFSPNEDDVNTVWFPRFTSTLTIELTIYNRWGEKLFYSNDNTGKWDGTYNGNPAPEGVYYYHLKVRDNRKKWHFYNGTLSLIR